jgi:hypothetical protein
VPPVVQRGSDSAQRVPALAQVADRFLRPHCASTTCSPLCFEFVSQEEQDAPEACPPSPLTPIGTRFSIF